ncbi:DNA topoisomerase IB [Lutimaribacter marinistellae]|uniref:DNA topoisomerase IB n=1 Tax=Lutimaribacter marinistellae TaxID=1820329 RepID=A0ABV7TLG1_9RHOB
MTPAEFKAAGLRYYPDTEPGISRLRRGRGFSYRAPDGTTIADRKKRAEIEALAVPPAYEDVWISPYGDGHLQATGRDNRRRKQYMYHPDWTAYQSQRKFDSLPELAVALPRVRRWIGRCLSGAREAEDSALAKCLALIERMSLRVGSPAYRDENGSHGVTTLENRHFVGLLGRPHLAFRAKGGTVFCLPVAGSALARALQNRMGAPRDPLVKYRNKSNAPHAVRPEQVNERLSALCNSDVTARQIRTWNGTLAAFRVAARPGPVSITEMAEAAANVLGNTPSVARESYIHPDVIALSEKETRPVTKPPQRYWRRGEKELLELLNQRA